VPVSKMPRGYTIPETISTYTQHGAPAMAKFYTEKMGWKLVSKKAIYNEKTCLWEIKFFRKIDQK